MKPRASSSSSVALVALVAAAAAACQSSASQDPIDDTELHTLPVLSSPWSNRDIGGVGLKGDATPSGSRITVKGSGADLFGTGDEFHFGYMSVNGDASVTATVASLQNTHAFAKAAVMIRQDLTPGSAYVSALVTPGGDKGFRRQHRVTAGTETLSARSTEASVIPSHLRVVRTGSSFQVAYSTNGTTWKSIGSPVTVNMPGVVLVGIGVTSHDDTKLATAAFDNVRVTGMAPGCTSDSMCPGGVCRGGACVPTCPTGTKSCGGGVCVPLTGCCTSGECGGGQQCLGGRCECPQGLRNCGGTCRQCCSDAECGNGMVCLAGACQCPGGTMQCTGPCGEKSCKECCDSSQCTGGRVCVGGSCACAPPMRMCATGCAQCCTTPDCPSGHICQGGSCRPEITCAPAGQPCGAGGCCNGLICIAGVCQAGCAPAGQPCTGGGCCNGLTCASGTCQSCGATGQRCCTSSSPCQAGLVCDASSRCSAAP